MALVPKSIVIIYKNDKSAAELYILFTVGDVDF